MLTSSEIDRAVRDAAARGDTLYWVDRERLAAARADVVFTQEVCDVCQIGTAVVEITAVPHTGCGKFTSRFGIEAMKFVNSPLGRDMQLRGVNAKVVVPGTVRVGDVARKR